MLNKSLKLNPTNWKIFLLTPAFYLLLLGNVTSTIPAIAQSEDTQNITQPESETKVETDNIEESTADTVTIEENSLEKAIIAEINRARTNPQEYANWLEEQKQYYQGAILKLPGEKPVRVNKGLRNLEEAIAFLRQQNKLSSIDTSEELTATAQQRITAINNNQISDRNNLVFEKVTPEAIVMQLIVDDKFPDRRHRLAIFDRSNQNAGIVCSDIAVYNRVCAIALNTEATVTQQPTQTSSSPSDTADSDTKPEVFVTTNNNQLPTPPEVNTAEAVESEIINKETSTTDVQVETTNTPVETTANTPSETEATNTPIETTNNTPSTINNQPSETEATNTPVETTANTPTETETTDTPVETTNNQPTETEATNTPVETTNNTPSTINNQPSETETIETPVETTNNQPTETEANNTPVETTNNQPTETEANNTPVETTNNQPTETEANNTPVETTANTPSETEANNTPIETTNNQSSETEANNTPVETTNNQPSTINNQPSETETPTEIAVNSQPVEIVKQGILEEGDDVIPNDGSFYDSYPLEGKPGDSFTIILESQDFDTFLAVMDKGGNIIKQNDDISEQDSNSRLEITLSEDEEYSIIVNAYDQQGKGNYILKLLR